MTNPQKVFYFLKKKAWEGYCDDCLGNFLTINRHEVHAITSSLGLTTEFTRTLAICPQQCSTREKLVKRYNWMPQRFVSGASADEMDSIRGESL
jgi:hypothetical protein